MTKLRLCALVLSLSLAAACGASDDADKTPESVPDHVIEPYELVPLSPRLGPGSPIDVTGARIIAGGALQLLVSGYSCGVPTRLQFNESPEQVTVTAYAARYGDGPCPANIVPWYVGADTEAPLGQRQLFDGRTGKSIRVER